jgi:hypothetical protein
MNIGLPGYRFGKVHNLNSMPFSQGFFGENLLSWCIDGRRFLTTKAPKHTGSPIII